jgi:hypothetical protein
VSRHEYLLDEYKAPRVSLSRIASDLFACPKDAELSKSSLEIEIGPGSNVTAGVAQIAGCRFPVKARCLLYRPNNRLDGVYSANSQGANRHMFNDRGG